MAFRLSYNSLSWKDTPDMERMLRDIKEAGWEGWEVRQPLDWIGSAARLRALVEAVGLPVAAVCGSGIALGDPFCVQINQRRIDLAADLGADVFLFIPPPRPKHRAITTEERGALAAISEELAVYGAQRGVDVCFHPHTDGLIQTRSEWEPMLEKAPHLKMVWEIAHAVLLGDDPVSIMRDLGARVAYVHLQDFKAWRFVNLGCGDIYDIPAMLKELERVGYSRWVTVHGGDFEEASQAQCAAACRSYLRSVGY